MSTEYKEAERVFLVGKGFTAEELSWADENPYIRALQEGFRAGWIAGGRV